jgi:hypothetical protein
VAVVRYSDGVPANRAAEYTQMMRQANKDKDASTLRLILVIALLITANLLLRVPDAVLSVDQINQMPLWGP